MEETKKGSVFAGLCKAAAVIGLIHAALIALGRYMSMRATEQEKHNEGQKRKRYLTFMNGKDVRISKEEVSEISIRSCMGGVNLDLTDAYITEDMEIKIKCVMSGVSIKVPPMVRVELGGSNVMSGFANLVPNYEAEGLPTIYIYAESIMGGISVQMVPEA